MKRLHKAHQAFVDRAKGMIPDDIDAAELVAGEGIALLIC